ncbi:galactosamine-6-phosphate isomerase [Flagellimonas sp. S3867]|uniref:galactosamine-6-phosphate isomerase n=1 Tax=Flagellimonas sp. S3867 TaxID=2768063 RepID=UPI0016888EF2|nr:galactosamine-6-phosphate isomerase [Flagellimonas sp. S3867]
MRIHHFENKKPFATAAVELLIKEIDRKPDLLLCAATGNSPLPVYRKLVEDAISNSERYARLRIIKLDEWIGLKDKNGSCETYLQKELVKPLKIATKNCIAFDEETRNPEKECIRIQRKLIEEGPIDLCVLGLGKNGHLGFNEPPASSTQECHVAHLAAESQQHNMIANQMQKPEFGMTLGIKDILNSKRVVLLISGEGKEKAKQQLLSSKVDPQCPASFLWMHNNVDCFVMD